MTEKDEILDEGSPQFQIREAEITEDGYLVVEFNQKISPGFTHTKRAVFDPEMLFELVCEYGEIPPAEETDFPGIPHVELEDVFPDDDEDAGDDPLAPEGDEIEPEPHGFEEEEEKK